MSFDTEKDQKTKEDTERPKSFSPTLCLLFPSL
jgi:hypothetical protein